MKKKIALILTLALLAGILAGCAGTPVIYYTECDCPEGSHTAPDNSAGGSSSKPDSAPDTNAGSDGSALKTGLAIVGSASDSADGTAKYDVTIVGVLVDDNGVIQDCIIDSVGASVIFDASGAITSDVNAAVATKNELGDNYGMVAYGGAKYEWYQQAAALADYAKGKTLDELKNGAIDETGKAPAGTDLASTATIYLGGYVSAIEAAVGNAAHIGASSGDELRLAIINTLGSSKSATAEKDGTAQLDCDVTALTVKDGVITSCYIDALQAKVSFNASGAITSDVSAPLQTKNQLGENYGMVAWGGAIAEWDEQAASFAAYVTGKTAEEVSGIAVSEGKPSDTDLSSSVTIAIGGFQALIAKALA